MKKVVLDGAVLTNMEDVHEFLARELFFPEWYGKNLDALHDCLTDIHEDVRIVFIKKKQMKQRLGGYYPRLVRVFRDSSEENPHIKFSRRNEM
ncbi:MAG: barstar family protein [Clostridia bacterium]|nr:barstar family protein [Clostridia bacterium]